MTGIDVATGPNLPMWPQVLDKAGRENQHPTPDQLASIIQREGVPDGQAREYVAAYLRSTCEPTRIWIGDVFRVTESRLQPATLPTDNAAAGRELHELQEKNRDLITDARSGERQRDAGAQGGRSRAGKRKAGDVTDDQLRAEVHAMVDAGESETNAHKRVGKKYGIPRTTMRRRTALK